VLCEIGITTLNCGNTHILNILVWPLWEDAAPLVTICNIKAFENLREEITGLHTEGCGVIKVT